MSRTLKVLIVDDNYEWRLLARHYFVNAGVPVEIEMAETGLKALERVRLEGYPDIILLDVNMPEMDGYTFVLYYKQLPQALANTKIYIVSNFLMEWTIEKFNNTHAVSGIFEKPFTKEHLQLILKEVTEGAQAE